MVTKKGTIARLVKERGFGFITPDDSSSADHFFNAQGVTGQRTFAELNVGDHVTFLATLTEKGPRAIEVRVD